MNHNVSVYVNGHAICQACQANASITHILRDLTWLVRCTNCGFDQARKTIDLCGEKCHELAHHKKVNHV